MKAKVSEELGARTLPILFNNISKKYDSNI